MLYDIGVNVINFREEDCLKYTVQYNGYEIFSSKKRQFFKYFNAK